MIGVQTCALPICFPVTIMKAALDCGDESVTQQCFKDECDINILLAKFAVTGQLPENVRVPQYVDFEEAFDFQSSMNVIPRA